jgi:hypothetical protein
MLRSYFTKIQANRAARTLYEELIKVVTSVENLQTDGTIKAVGRFTKMHGRQ